MFGKSFAAVAVRIPHQPIRRVHICRDDASRLPIRRWDPYCGERVIVGYETVCR
ncbi:hypothetical protein [Jiella sp. M17.18]|uniref:hypothetical protein n=1 Tax=Jiella sp. M17.18 TaxID=3234247 RepID=UPI0034DF064E